MSHYHPQETAGHFKFNQSAVLPWIVWGLACLFYFYECMLQVSTSVMSNQLMSDFSITSQGLGFLAAIYFYSYAVMQLPAGLMLDSLGPRRLLTIATLICAIGTIAFGMTSNYYMACLTRLMIGFGSAFAAIGTLKLAANWFSSDKFAFMTGLMVTVGMIGAINGETPLGKMVEYFGWRHSLILLGVIGILLTALIFIVVKDTPTQKTYVSEHQKEPLLSNLAKLLSNKQLWLVALYGGLMYVSTPVFCGLWGRNFLTMSMNISNNEASNLIIVVFVGWAIASPLWGIFSNRIGLRKPPMYIGVIGLITSLSLIIYAPIHSCFTMGILLFLFGVFSAGFLPAFALAKELCSKQYVATGLSFMNMMNMICIPVYHHLIGERLDNHWAGQLVEGARVYPVSAYHIALAILPIGGLIALLLLPMLKETHCQSVDQSVEH